MKRLSPIRCGVAVAGVLLGGVSYLGGQTGQATPPSTPISTLPPARPTSAAAQPAGTAGQTSAEPAVEHHAEVNYTDGMLSVRATNASLNEILREVSQRTGMKITGGVTDDKVFGNYGPSTPEVVLDALLDGTGSNMLLVNDAKGGSELILTPRRGGPTPPSPNAGRQTNEAEENNGGYVPPVRPYLPPNATGRGPGGFGGPDFPGAPPGAEAPGGGNKTPQEIYEQLQQTMQQKNAAQQQQ